MNEELKHIKKLYGEDMMHFCRKNFPTILNDKDKLLNLLKNNFNERKDLYKDLEEQELLYSFENYIDYIDNPQKVKWIDTGLEPEELLKQNGYELYEVKSKKDLDHFKKYYDKEELLCSFSDEDRTKEKYIYFLIKDNALLLNRDDFIFPKRSDEYSLSVLCVQFKKDNNNNKISIISRYNHGVENPDATLDNNLDNLIPGLSMSFKKKYNLEFNRPEEDFSIIGYSKSSKTNKFYKVNVATKDYAFCPNNVILTKDGENTNYSNENNASYILMDGYLLDINNKKFISFYEDSFLDAYLNITNIKINYNKNTNSKIIEITSNDDDISYIILNNNNQIIGYGNNNIIQIKKNFMLYNTTLKFLSLPKVENIDNNFLINNKELTDLYLPSAKFIAHNVLVRNKKLTSIYAPNVLAIGDNFCNLAYTIRSLNVLDVKMIGNNFLRFNNALNVINLPNVINIGDRCFEYECSSEFNAPKMISCGKYVLRNSAFIERVQLNSLREFGDQFLEGAKSIQEQVKKDIIHRNFNSDIVVDKLCRTRKKGSLQN